MHHEPTTEVFPGDITGFSIKGITKASDLRRGDVIGLPETPPKRVSEVLAIVSVLN